MEFGIEDILNETLMGKTKEEWLEIIAEVLNDETM